MNNLNGQELLNCPTIVSFCPFAELGLIQCNFAKKISVD
jgi:hypothetical protein